MKRNTNIVEALILKRNNVGEADRVVTLITAEFGKISAVAKGVRKITSSQRAYLEPGNMVKILLVQTNSLPLITQTKLLSDCSTIRHDLTKLRQLSAVLETVDSLLVAESLEEEIFELIRQIRHSVLQTGSAGKLRQQLLYLLQMLGFTESDEQKIGASVTDLIEQITEKPLKSWQFLTV